ncbi:hypothetical protein [Streptomyces smyrnaeus]|uniref:hypothetical protein n=1 Tax=Streptomyces smyrnaeus TaxID=1387713 RepID=UPI0036763149
MASESSRLLYLSANIEGPFLTDCLVEFREDTLLVVLVAGQLYPCLLQGVLGFGARWWVQTLEKGAAAGAQLSHVLDRSRALLFLQDTDEP